MGRKNRNTNKALKALKRKRASFKTGGNASSDKRSAPTYISDPDNPNKDMLEAQRRGQVTTSGLTAPKANVAGMPDDSTTYQTQEDKISKIDSDDLTKASAGTATASSATTVNTGSKKDAQEAEYGVPQGYTLTPGNRGYTQVMPAMGKVFAYNKETGARIEIDDPKKAPSYTAEKVDDLDPTDAASGSVTTKAEAKDANLSERAVAADRDSKEEEEALGEAAQRPEQKDYADGVTTDEKFTVSEPEGPEVATRDAKTISEREKKDVLDIVTKEGVDLDKIPEFNLAKEREAQVGEAKTKKANQLKEIPQTELKTREAITGEPPKGDAAQIGGVPTAEAAKMDAVTGTERVTSAADMLAVVGNVPPEISAAIAEDPASVEAQLDEGGDPQVKAAVASLPQEALVSTQMEGLLAGMEEGKTPAWARPAVAAIEQQMARRGLSASTVGRDALFNAIIQSALPMAQSNAQALQQRAQQNLSNEQQANLASAQNTMSIRMANLANRQTAASQSAEMAQQIKIQQGEFEQQAVLTTAKQQQESRQQNIINQQQKASQESSQRQQAALANLDAASRLDLANLQALNAAEGQNLSAEQQTRLASYNAKINRIMRQADLDQDMEKANLDSSLRMEMMNLTEENAASRESMSAKNQERLVNLQTLIDFKKTNVSLAQQMDLANLSNEQQMEMANLAERAAADSANMTEANRMKLQEYVTYVDVMSKNEQLRLSAEMAQLGAAEKISLANLTAKNQADSESMSAENMAELQKYEKKMSAAQLNANLAQQMGLANLTNEQQASMFNAQIDANMDMKQFDANQQMALANSQFMKSMTMKNLDNKQQAAMQNATALASMDLANADARTRVSIENAKSFLAMDMANLSNEQQAVVLDQQMKQQQVLSEAASINASRQFNATSKQQTDQYIAGLGQQMNQFNSAQSNAMEQFNATEKNRMTAIREGNTLEADKLNAQLKTQVEQFNAQMDYNAEQWNAANAQAVEQSNITWRRNTNTAETAAKNAANQQSAGFQFNMDMATQSQMWQELRDTASYNRQAYENERNRLVGVVSSALSNEAFMTDDSFSTQRTALFEMLEGVAESVDSTKSGNIQEGVDNAFTDEDGNRFNTDTDGDGVPDTYVPPD
jgi:hypothetical protein